MATHEATNQRPAHAAGRVPAILAVTSELPWPLDTGGHLRTFHLLRALARRFNVRLVVPAEARQAGSIDALRENGLAVVPVPVAPRSLWREALRAAGAAARREPYVLYRRHDHSAVRSALVAEAGREAPDIIYLDHLDSWVYRVAVPRLPAVIDLHNIYSVLTRRAVAERRSPWARRYLEREVTLLSRMERRVANSGDILMTVSEQDRLHFASLGSSPAHLVPNGVDCSTYAGLSAGRESSRPILLYIGSLSWGPNAAAARTLAVELLPRVRERFPGTCVRLVGRNPSPEVAELGHLDGVEVFGSVPDVLPHLREATLLVVPLEAGGGTRLKILEAFAAGLPVVSTPVGCEGIDIVDGEHLVVADRPQLVDAIVSLLDDPTSSAEMAKRARTLARGRYDWSIVGDATCQAVEAAIRGGAR